MPTEAAISVSELNRKARALLERGIARLWVEGEISNMARPASGHIYFSLKDETAQVSAAWFRIGFRIAAAARDPFAGLTAVGILSILAFQVFVNIGVTLGLVPVTGLPLPIYSYGGTSLISTLAGLGIVLGVNLRRRM